MFGSAIHKGLEGYFLGKKKAPNDPETWKASMLALYIDHTTLLKETAEREYGFLWSQASESFNDLFELGRKILLNYIEFDKTAEVPIYPRIIEKRVFLPLDSQGRNILTMRWDVMGETYNRLSAIFDHKTSGGAITTRGLVLDMDEQMTSYAYGFWRLYERQRTADLVIHDTLAKKIPAPIKVLKSGKLSTDKGQDTILPILLDTIKAYGDDVERFQDFIGVLKEKGWSSYFTREASPRNQHQLESYEERVRFIFEEMRSCIEDPRLAYPTPGPIKCPSCPFRSPCLAMEEGGDYQYLLNMSFTRDAKTVWTIPRRYRDSTG